MKKICPNPALNANRPPGEKFEFTESVSLPRFRVEKTISHTEIYHDLWKEVHTKQDPTEDWFANWVAKIPFIGCGCREWVIDYIKLNPPRYKDWFRWSWELHNAVDQKLSKLQLSFNDARACWLNLGPQTKPRLILTIAVGTKFTDLLTHTRPLMEAYAERCGADFLALTNKKFTQWQREKFRVHDFTQQYEQTLFLDSDVLIKPTADNIFEVYKDADVAMHDDLPKNPTTILDGSWDWRGEYTDMLSSQDVAWYKPDEVMWNTGVVLTSKSGSDVWAPPTKLLASHHCSEQFFVQHQCRGVEVSPMHAKYNWQYWFKDFADHVDEAHFIHLANCPNKLEYVKKYLP